MIKAAISPRPANWILERSLDGQVWAPWQFFATSDEECWHAYGVEPKVGKPNSYRYDEEVICTSYYSKLKPLEMRPLFILDFDYCPSKRKTSFMST